MSRTLRLSLAVAWTLGIFVATTIPLSSVPDVNGTHLDKVVHFVMFFGFGWLWMWSLGLSPARRFALVGAAGLALALGTEGLQEIIGFGRSGERWDLAVNLVGLFSAMGLYLLLRRARQVTPVVES